MATLVRLYDAALGRKAGEVENWAALLDHGAVDRGDLLLGFAEPAEMIGLVGVITTSMETL